MKIIGIMSIGTYYSPWFPYTIASIYNVCDTIVVANVGYNINYPNENQWVPLKKVSGEIKRLDINKKIIELNKITSDSLRTKFPVMTQKEADSLHINNWYDMRGVGITAASEKAYSLGAEWILKIDTDQVVYNDIDRLRHFLHVFPGNGVKFHQYEFTGDIGGERNYLSNPKPHTPYNDSVFCYKAMQGQYYGGGGAPEIFLPGQDRLNTDVFHAAHLRMCNPIWISDKEKYEHFFGRAWFQLYTNNYGKFCPELYEHAKKDASHRLNGENKGEIFNPPEVCLFKDPLDYIVKNSRY
jgi:hypothetical protein